MKLIKSGLGIIIKEKRRWIWMDQQEINKLLQFLERIAIALEKIYNKLE